MNYPSRISIGMKQKNFALGCRKQQAKSTACRRKRNGNMPVALERQQHFRRASDYCWQQQTSKTTLLILQQIKDLTQREQYRLAVWERQTHSAYTTCMVM